MSGVTKVPYDEARIAEVMREMKLAIAVPVDWNYVHLDTFKSLMILHKPLSWSFYDSPRGGDISEKREAQAEKAIKEGMTHILFLDADMIFPPRTIPFLLDAMEKGADLCGILSYRGYQPYEPLIWDMKAKNILKPGTDYQFGDLVDAGATGAGCLMIKTEVLKHLPRPWFQVIEQEEEGVVYKRGEDLYFTHKAVQAGFSLKVVTELDTQHIREVGVDRYYWAAWTLVHKIVSKHGWGGVFQAMSEFDNK